MNVFTSTYINSLACFSNKNLMLNIEHNAPEMQLESSAHLTVIYTEHCFTFSY